MPLAVKAYTIGGARDSGAVVRGRAPTAHAARRLSVGGLRSRAGCRHRAYNIVLGTSVVLLVALTYVTTTTLAAVP